MSENEETQIETEQEATIANSVTGDKIKIRASPEDLKKLRELTEMQNEQNKKIMAENSELKNKLLDKGNQGAPLNYQQTRKEGEEEQKDIVSPDLDPEFWSFTSHSAMFKALQDTANDSQNPQQKSAQQILSKLIKKQHKQGGVYELQGSLTNITKKGAKQPYFEKIKEEE